MKSAMSLKRLSEGYAGVVRAKRVDNKCTLMRGEGEVFVDVGRCKGFTRREDKGLEALDMNLFIFIFIFMLH